MKQDMRFFKIVDREGPEDFETTLAFQQTLLRSKVEDRNLLDTLVLVEHEEVYTAGRGCEFQSPSDEGASKVPWVEIGRGGQATFHGPGQLVAYPIFDLEHHGRDVHVFLRMLEETIIRTLAEFDVVGQRRDGLTGVWVNHNEQWKKIASVGIGVRRWVSHHGLALNVSPNLDYFRAISACGQDGSVMTSLEEIRRSMDRVTPSMAEVKQALSLAFADVFSMALDEEKSLLAGQRPRWVRAKAPGSPEFLETLDIVKSKGLVTVCEEARCPNMGECWSHHTATFMIMGELCTRRCAFCSVKDGLKANLEPLDIFEPLKVAHAVKELNLKHIVVTSVNRDDLEDMGAAHFHRTAKAIRDANPECKIEFLIPDMRGRRELVESILQDELVHVLNHNIETVPRLYRTVRPGAKFDRSLDILRWAKEIHPAVKTKCGIMVGLGERRDEVIEVMERLREIDVSIMTIGQYLQPSKKQLPVKRYVTPEEFEDYRVEGLKRGFSFVESGTFVRSSYHAWKHTEEAELAEQRAAESVHTHAAL